jgi:hypothetical protein
MSGLILFMSLAAFTMFIIQEVMGNHTEGIMLFCTALILLAMNERRK